MRKIVYSVALVMMAFLFSCKEEYMLYDVAQINKIYFDENRAEYFYGPRADKAVDMELKVNLIGFANLEGDAEFVVSPDDSRSTAKYGVHYEFAEKPRFNKDSTVAYVKLDLKRQNMVKDIVYTAHLNLGTNDTYTPTNVTKCLVQFGDVYVPQPTWWMADRLGTYTPEKYIMFVQLFQATKNDYKEIYAEIVGYWGEYLDKTDHSRHKFLLTTAVYLGYFKKEVYVPMYAYYLDTSDENYRIPDPMDPNNNY